MPGVTTAYQNGIHASRPAANSGCILYACSTHSLIYRSDGSSWTTWMTIGSTTTTVASDAIWDAAGDLAIGTGADTAAKLSIGAASKVLQSDGTTGAWKFPPGYEIAYVEFTSTVSVTATTEAGGNTVVSAGAVAFDGSTIVEIQFYTPDAAPAGANNALSLMLFDGSTSLGFIGRIYNNTGPTDLESSMHLAKRITPSNASHTYSVRAMTGSGTASIIAGAGAAGNWNPGFIRIVKVSGGA